jgi:hypothetical protein
LALRAGLAPFVDQIASRRGRTGQADHPLRFREPAAADASRREKTATRLGLEHASEGDVDRVDPLIQTHREIVQEEPATVRRIFSRPLAEKGALNSASNADVRLRTQCLSEGEDDS